MTSFFARTSVLVLECPSHIHVAIRVREANVPTKTGDDLAAVPCGKFSIKSIVSVREMELARPSGHFPQPTREPWLQRVP